MRGRRQSRWLTPAGATATAVFAATALWLTLLFKTNWPWLPSYLLAAQLPAFLLYGFDKRAAIKKNPRVPERTLHVCALAGGSPAAYIAQLLFRHKTQKKSFQRVFWLLVVAQASLLAWALLR